MRYQHHHPGCPLNGRLGTQVRPDPEREPPSMTHGKSVKVLFDDTPPSPWTGKPEAIWVALEHCVTVSR